VRRETEPAPGLDTKRTRFTVVKGKRLPLTRPGAGYPAGVDFQIDHAFDVPPGRLAEVLLDRSFQDSLSDLDGLAERTVLDQQTDGDIVIRRTRYVLDIKISGAAKGFLGDGDPAWVERAEWDPGSSRWTWTIEPEVAAELLDAGGSTEIAKDGSGSIRRVRGTVKVKVPLYGSRVEKWVVQGLERAYDEEARRIEQWLSS
jgi:hypothetical protein